jgi:hypothetical protein
MSLDRSVVGLLVEMRHERPHTYGQSNMRRETNVLVRRSSLQPGGGLGLFSAWCLLRLAVTRGALNPPRCDDARDPVQYLLHLPYLTPSDRRQLVGIHALALEQRVRAATAIAAQLEREARYIGYADRATAELVSKRVGCRIDQPEYPGIDLAALCLRDG